MPRKSKQVVWHKKTGKFIPPKFLRVRNSTRNSLSESETPPAPQSEASVSLGIGKDNLPDTQGTRLSDSQGLIFRRQRRLKDFQKKFAEQIHNAV